MAGGVCQEVALKVHLAPTYNFGTRRERIVPKSRVRKYGGKAHVEVV